MSLRFLFFFRFFAHFRDSTDDDTFVYVRVKFVRKRAYLLSNDCRLVFPCVVTTQLELKSGGDEKRSLPIVLT